VARSWRTLKERSLLWAGTGGVLVIQGPAGIGKSALVRVLGEHAAGQGSADVERASQRAGT
jgi:MoxR-like ATPase